MDLHKIRTAWTGGRRPDLRPKGTLPGPDTLGRRIRTLPTGRTADTGVAVITALRDAYHVLREQTPGGVAGNKSNSSPCSIVIAEECNSADPCFAGHQGGASAVYAGPSTVAASQRGYRVPAPLWPVVESAPEVSR
jgi:hypothetical protein